MTTTNTLKTVFLLGLLSALLLIGDTALRERMNSQGLFVYDLGELWRELTGLPFVFALWIVTRQAAEKKAGEVRNLAARHEIIYLSFANAWDLPRKSLLEPLCREVLIVPFPGGSDGRYRTASCGIQRQSHPMILRQWPVRVPLQVPAEQQQREHSHFERSAGTRAAGRRSPNAGRKPQAASRQPERSL